MLGFSHSFFPQALYSFFRLYLSSFYAEGGSIQVHTIARLT